MGEVLSTLDPRPRVFGFNGKTLLKLYLLFLHSGTPVTCTVPSQRVEGIRPEVTYTVPS